MLTRFVCLANSFKEGGRCLAGIELYGNNKPVITHGQAKWIRPVCSTTPHGEVHTHLVAYLNLLDIIEINITGKPPEKNYQSENVFFAENSIKVLSRFDIENLTAICDNRNLIFGNRGKALSEEAIVSLSYSLMLIRVDQFEVIEKVYADNHNKPQIRLAFFYGSNHYNLPITDPFFIHNYQHKSSFMNAIKELLVCVSLGIAFNDWYYKLAAGIIFKQ